MKYGSIIMEFKLNAALDANSGDTLRVNTGGRQGVKNILILMTLKTVLKTRELDI